MIFSHASVMSQSRICFLFKPLRPFAPSVAASLCLVVQVSVGRRECVRMKRTRRSRALESSGEKSSMSDSTRSNKIKTYPPGLTMRKSSEKNMLTTC